ncbi:hypothetical protein GP486_008330 [Trichoglossum hirsutum]|uniref:Orotate phosphoribosyltransferase n=1 Tax=Trichoglossum hirsutum TaxID=265104 RepID=A0A9P8IE67_9PEZI|nr:hypothetical protein GP486_008330 [Trichoglossum hirsutum]
MTGAATNYKTNFLETCIDGGVLTFGTFKLKSGRVSPYFFNAGLLHRADLLQSTSAAYAHTIRGSAGEKALEFDVLFGPAYKGIPLAVATVAELARLDPGRFGRVSYAFDRKEAKDHGERGRVVGCPLQGRRVLVVDDVITAGTAVRQAIDVIEREGGRLVGVVVSVDRMERMPPPPDGDESAPGPSAIGQIRKQYGVPVLSILTLDDIMDELGKLGAEEDMRRLAEYRAKYRADD